MSFAASTNGIPQYRANIRAQTHSPREAAQPADRAMLESNSASQPFAAVRAAEQVGHLKIIRMALARRGEHDVDPPALPLDDAPDAAKAGGVGDGTAAELHCNDSHQDSSKPHGDDARLQGGKRPVARE